MERILSTVIQNGMRQGWIDLGHKDSEISTLLQNLPGQPLALRKLDGSANETLDSFGPAPLDADDPNEDPSTVLKEIRQADPLNKGFAAMDAAALGQLAKAHVAHTVKSHKAARPARQPEPPVDTKEPILEEDDDTQRPS